MSTICVEKKCIYRNNKSYNHCGTCAGFYDEPLKEKTEPVAKSPDCNALLGTLHTGCRISAPGILGRIRDGWKLDNGMRYATGEMLKHLEETAKRFYAGDAKAIDEFLQLYCLDETRP